MFLFCGLYQPRTIICVLSYCIVIIRLELLLRCRVTFFPPRYFMSALFRALKCIYITNNRVNNKIFYSFARLPKKKIITKIRKYNGTNEIFTLKTSEHAFFIYQITREKPEYVKRHKYIIA